MARLPPGQILTRKWPVLHSGHVPAIDTATWRFTVTGLVVRSLSLTWSEVTGAWRPDLARMRRGPRR